MGRVIPENFRGFDPTKFQKDDHVLFYADGEWHIGKLDDLPPGAPGVSRVGVFEMSSTGDTVAMKISGLPSLIELRRPPKKVEYNIGQSIDIGGVSYSVHDIGPGTNGDIEYELTDGTRTLKHIKQESLDNVHVLEDTEHTLETKMQTLVDKVKTIVGEKRSQFMNRLSAIEKRIVDLYEHIGPSSNWHAKESAELLQSGQEIKRIKAELVAEAQSMEREIDAIPSESGSAKENKEKGDVARGFSARYDREMKRKEDEARNKFNKNEHDDWKKTKKTYDDWKKIKDAHDAWVKAAPQRPKKGPMPPDTRGPEPPLPPPEPTRPGDEPQFKNPAEEPKEKQKKYLELYNGLDDTIPGQKKLKDEVDKRRKEKAGLEGHADYDPKSKDFKEITAEIMSEVLSEWKDLTGAVEGVDLKKEKKELHDKIDELKTRIEALPLGVARTKLEHDLAIAKTAVDGIDAAAKTMTASPLTTETDVEKAIIDFWRAVGKVEVDLYYVEKSQAPVDAAQIERKEDIAISIPTELMMKILDGRWNIQVTNAVNLAYKEKLERNVDPRLGVSAPRSNETVRLAVLEIFRGEPSADVLVELRKLGIKDWKHFQKLLEGEMGKSLTLMIHKMADERLTAETAKRQSGLAVMKATWMHALPRTVANIALVGGGALALSALLAPASALAAVGVTVAGGLAGGGAKGLLQGLVYKIPGLRKHRDKKLQEQQEKLRVDTAAILTKEKNQDANGFFGHIKRWYQDVFGGIVSQEEIVNFADDTNKYIFAGMVAEGIEQSTSKHVSKEGEETDEQVKQKLAGLSGEHRAMYFGGITRARDQEGIELSVEKKLEFIAVIAHIHDGRPDIVQKAMENVDPFWFRMLEGSFQGMSGQLGEKHGLVRGTAECAVVGGAMSIAFVAGGEATRAALGAAGGFASGYRKAGIEMVSKEARRTNQDAVEAFTWIQELRAGNTANRDKLFERFHKFQNILGGGEDKVDQRVRAERSETRNLMERVVKETQEIMKLNAQQALAELQQQRERVDKAKERSWGKRFSEIGKRIKHGIKHIARDVASGIGIAVLVGEVIDYAKESETGQAIQAQLRGITHDTAGARASHVIEEAKGHAHQQIEQGVKIAAASRVNPEPTGGAGRGTISPDSTHRGLGGAIAQKEGHDLGAHRAELSPDEFLSSHKELSQAESDYIRRLTAQYPELLQDESSLEKLLEAGQYARGKGSMFGDAFKGNVDTPLEAARQADMVKFEEILKHGGEARAAEYLEGRGFNAKALRHLGLDASHPDYKGFAHSYKTSVLDASEGNKDTSLMHKLGSTLQADENRDMYAYKDEKGHGLFDEGKRAGFRTKGGPIRMLGMDETEGGDARNLVHGNADERVYEKQPSVSQDVEPPQAKELHHAVKTVEGHSYDVYDAPHQPGFEDVRLAYEGDVLKGYMIGDQFMPYLSDGVGPSIPLTVHELLAVAGQETTGAARGSVFDLKLDDYGRTTGAATGDALDDTESEAYEQALVDDEDLDDEPHETTPLETAGSKMGQTIKVEGMEYKIDRDVSGKMVGYRGASVDGLGGPPRADVHKAVFTSDFPHSQTIAGSEGSKSMMKIYMDEKLLDQMKGSDRSFMARTLKTDMESFAKKFGGGMGAVELFKPDMLKKAGF